MPKEVDFFELIADASGFVEGFDKSIGKAKEFRSEFARMRREVETGSATIYESLSRKVGGAWAQVQKNAAGRTITQTVQLGARSVETAALAVGGVVAAGAGAMAVLNHLIDDYAEWSSQILRNSAALGVNSQDLQTWEKIAQRVNMQAGDIPVLFGRFAKNLAEGAPGLKAAGVDLATLGINTTNAGKAILQLADYLHQNTDESQKAAIATALFGRNGAQLLPILNQGSAAFRQYQEELRRTGVLLSDNELIAGAQARAAGQELGDAFEGAKNRLLSQALPGFTAYFRILTQLVESNAPTFEAWGEAVGKVLLFITGLLAGITGTPLKDLNSQAKTGASAYDGLAGSVQGASDSVGQQTSAIQDQKTALEQLQVQVQRQIDQLDQETQAIDDQTRAYDDKIEAQKQALQAQIDQADLVDNSRRRAGEDLVSYERRLDRQNLESKIKSLDAQKSTYDRAQEDRKRALERQRADLERELRSETTSYKQAALDQAAAQQLSYDAETRGADAMISAVQQRLAKSQGAVLGAAQGWGAAIRQFFVDFAADPDGTMGNAFVSLGGHLINSLINGMTSPEAIFGQYYNKKTGQIDWGSFFGHEGGFNNVQFNTPADKAIGELFNELGTWLSHLPGHAAGGVFDQEHLARISEGNRREAVIPVNDPTRALALMRQTGLDRLAAATHGGSSAGPSLQVAFNGPVGVDAAAWKLVRGIQREARRKGLLISAGGG